MVVSIIIRDINIVNSTVFGIVLRNDSIYVIFFHNKPKNYRFKRVFELKTITYMSSLFYTSSSYGRAVIVSIIIRDTNIFNNNVFEPFLLKDSTFGISFSIINQKSIFERVFEQKKITGLSYLLCISPSPGRAVVISIIIRDTNIVKNTVFEPILCKDSIYGITFSIINQQIIVSNAFLN